MLIVQKYGGSSIADAGRIFKVSERIIDSVKAGNKVVVVLSAQGDTTDDLIRKAKEINPEPSRRELDMLISTGEQQSVALMAMAIQRMGYRAVSLGAAQVKIVSSSVYGNARIKKIECERIQRELDNNSIVLITGFQGINKYNDITTLGRGASDTTAVALAAVLNGDLCEIYTDVDGIYTADPRIVPSATKINEISYDEMLELASLGAQVLHNRSIELAKKYNIKLVVRSSISRDEGTLVREAKKVEKTYVSGVAIDADIARISIIGIKDVPGMAFRVFSLLSKKRICVDIILQSISRQGSKDLSFTVSKADLDETLKTFSENQDFIQYDHISWDDKVAKLSIVGAGMAANPGVAASMFEALYDAGVNIQLISTSEIKISVLVGDHEASRAMNFVHEKFIDQNMGSSAEI